CCSSVVERTLGKGEVESSILSSSTIRALAIGRCIVHVAHHGRAGSRGGRADAAPPELRQGRASRDARLGAAVRDRCAGARVVRRAAARRVPAPGAPGGAVPDRARPAAPVPGARLPARRRPAARGARAAVPLGHRRAVRAGAAHRRPSGPDRARLRPRHAGAAHRGYAQRLGRPAGPRPRRRGRDARGNPRARQARDSVTKPVTAVSENWRRTSPLSFVVRAITGLRNLAFPALALVFGSQGWQGGGLFVAPALLAMVGFSWLFTWIAWRHFRYRVGEHDIRIEHGLISRSARAVPYERIQDVSLEQKPVPRLFGMVEVRFETGAGGKDEVRIAYVTLEEADALRETVRARKTGEAVAAGEAVAPVEEPSGTLFAMDPRRLVTFGLFEFSLVAFAVIGG